MATHKSGRQTKMNAGLSILCWNTNANDVKKQLAELCTSQNLNVLVLLELGIDPHELTAYLKEKGNFDFEIVNSINRRCTVLSRDSQLRLDEINSSDRLSMRKLHYDDTEFHLGIVHLVDKGNWDSEEQFGQVILLMQDVRKIEEHTGHSRTILIGDFNLNPFEKGMTSALGFNAMMTKNCITRDKRIVAGKSYPFFYNPMWSHFGDSSPGPAGTYYHPHSTQGTYGWNMLDQALFRGDSLPWFSEVRILDSTGFADLTNSQTRPDKLNNSDHLPILIRLKDKSCNSGPLN